MSISRTVLRTLVAAAILSLVGWVGTARATYCRLFIVGGFAKLNPPLDGGEIICVDCPVNGQCPGPNDVVFTATIRDTKGNVDDGRVRKADGSDCVDCPDPGKPGYSYVKVPKVGLVEDDIDWSTSGGRVHFHLTFRNTDHGNPSDGSAFDVFAQPAYGLFLQDGPILFHGNVPPMAPSSFFDVFFDIPLSQLPPPPSTHTGSVPKESPPSGAAPCGPGSIWSGNIDVVWSGLGGDGKVNKHLGSLLVTPGGATQYIHLLTGCAGPISWSIGPLCPGFSVALVNEDFSPAPASLPAGWTGWIRTSAGTSVLAGASCCVAINMLCGSVPARIDFCATACDQPTPTRRRSWSDVKMFYR